MSSKDTFLSIARQGKNGWLRYLFGLLMSLSIVMISYTVFLLVISYISDISIEEIGLSIFSNPFYTLIFTGLLGSASLLGLYLAIKVLHDRNFKTLFSSGNSIGWLRITKGFILWLGTYAITWVIWYLVYPYRYQLTFNIIEWLPLAINYLLISIILSFIRILFLFSYLLQGLSLIIQRRILLPIIWGIVIGSFSINFEFPEYWFTSIIYSIFITLIIIKDDRIELAIGMQIFDDFSRFTIISSVETKLVLSSVFQVNQPPNFYFLFMTYLVRFTLFYFLCFGKPRKPSIATMD